MWFKKTENHNTVVIMQSLPFSLINQPPKANSPFHPSGVGKWVPASAGKAKAGMVHSVSWWTRGVQVKLWDPLRTRAIPERLRGVITTRRYTNPHLPLPYLYLPSPSFLDLYTIASVGESMKEKSVKITFILQPTTGGGGNMFFDRPSDCPSVR